MGRMVIRRTRAFRFAAPAALAGLTLLAATGAAAAQPKLRYVGAGVSGGNGDDWAEPGETLALKLSLFNDGNAPAISVGGRLTYLGSHPSVAVTIPNATWPNLPAQGAPAVTNPPHFELQLGTQVPCGTLMPFRLDVDIGGAAVGSFDLTLKAGQRVDHDLLNDPFKRVDEQEATFWGAAAGGLLGSAMARGDIDGDGFDDIAVSAPLTDFHPGPDSGTVYLIYGRPQTWIDRDLGLSTPLITRFQGADPGDETGKASGSLAMCDVNGDGFDDLIVGAINADSLNNSRLDAGEVHLIYGKAIPWANTDLFNPTPGIVRLWGAQAGDGLGRAAACGDFNGDGFDDFLLGAPGGDSVANARPDAGEVYVVYGQAAPWMDTDLALPPAGVTRVWGVDSLDNLGYMVGSVDLNADGRDELVITAWHGDSINNSRNEAGEAYLIQGQSSPPADIDLAASPPGVARFWGADSPDQTGGSVGRIDLDEDGYEDLVIGVPNANSIGNTRALGGEVYLFHGGPAPWGDVDLASPPPGVIRVWGAQVEDHLGHSVAIGDMNGDGHADLAIASPHYSAPTCSTGRVFVIHGRKGLWADQDLATIPSTVSSFVGSDPCDQTGVAIASGDLNADGYDDLAIGSPEADSLDNLRMFGGEFYILYGKPTDTYYVTQPLGGPPPYVDTTTIKGVTKLPLNCDNCSVQIPIGFSFPFYAEAFSQVTVSSDGFLTFSTPPGGTVPTEACMPQRAGANHLIAPFWDDLNPGAFPAGGVYSLVQGTAPNRRLTVEWKDVPHAPNVGGITFQVTLYESTGQIHFRYKDLIFGDPALDKGASAVVGVENWTGAHGVAWSCNDSKVMSASPMVKFIPTTPVFEEHGELTGALWTPTGHWHDSTNSCEPDQHTGFRGWYYGNDASCTYSNGFSGALRAPTVEDFPADTRLTFWSRHGAQVGFDPAEVQLSTTGTSGPYNTFLDVTDNLLIWRYMGQTNLFGNTGDTVDLQFNFTSDGSVNSLGWMVDDLQLLGCDATGAAQVVQAVSYTPSLLCAGQAAFADSFGSYCGDSSDPVRYQWFEDGSIVPGAMEGSYRIPETLPPGDHEYSVEVTCESGAMALSEPAPVSVVLPPDPVAPTLMVELLDARPTPRLHFTWSPSAGVDEYVVLQDTFAGGMFMTEVGTAPASETQLTVPVPAGNLLYFLVAGRNAACGTGIH